MAKKREAILLWKQMKPVALRRLALAVFLMFGVLGPLSILMESRMEPVAWRFVIVQTISAGGLSASLVLFRSRKWWVRVLIILVWAQVFVLNSGGLSFVWDSNGFRVHLGGYEERKIKEQESKPLTVTPQQLDEIYIQRGILGILSIILLSTGYSRFVIVIRNEIRERTRLQTEVTIAQNIQKSLLPVTALHESWYHVAGLTLPATEVGGDYYDFIPLSKEQVAVVVADVAGHGVGPGILSAMTKGALHSQLAHAPEPASALGNLNTTLSSLADRRMFVTCGYVLIDKGTHLARIATAGHPPILFYHRANQHVEEIRTVNLALGLKQGSIFKDCVVPFSSGDALLLYTDGVFEASDEHGEQFGVDRLSEWFRAVIPNQPEDICSKLLTAIQEFSKSERTKDDVSVVCLKFT